MVTKERGTEASGLSLSNNQARELESHFSLGDTPGPAACSWQLSPDATGHFEVGTQAIGAAQVLAESLPYIRSLGVENIHSHPQPLLKKLREEIPRLGFPGSSYVAGHTTTLCSRLNLDGDTTEFFGELRHAKGKR